MSHGEVTSKVGKTVARWIFSNRQGGFSHSPFDSLNVASHVGDAPLAVAANRAKLAELLKVQPKDITWPGLVHGTDIGLITSPLSLFPDVDVLVTSTSKRALATMGGDCVPLLAVDPESKVALSAHIGWKGAADSIHEAIISALESAGGKPKFTNVFLGPAICGMCYVVEQDRFDLVTAQLPEAGVKLSDGRLGLDLRLGLQAALRAAGMRVNQIDGCTAESPDLYSFRRDGVTGRQAGLVVLV